MAEAAIPQVSLSMGSEAVFDIECAPCSQDGQHKEAESYCRDCGAHLCGDCLLDHKKVRSLKHHQLLDKEAMTTVQGNRQVLDACTERCPDHKREIIKFFCPDHKTTACSVCVTMNHKMCEDMEYIEDAAAGLEDRQDYKEFTARLGDLTQQSEDTVKLALEDRKRSSDSHTTAMEDLDAYREELVVAVDRHVEAIRDQAGQIHVQDTDKMDKLASKGNKVLTELRTVAINVNNLKSKKHFCKLYVEIKQNDKTFRELQGNLEGMKDDKVTSYTFRSDEDLRAMVNRQVGIGKLVVTSTECGSSTAKSKADQTTSKHGRGTSQGRNTADKTPSKQESGTSEGLIKADKAYSKQAVTVPTRNVQKMANINVKSSSNKITCRISGMVVVSDDKVVVADWYNDTIKLIDTTRNKIMSEHKPEKYVWDVTTCKDTVAATLPTVSKIVFLKHAGGLVHDREISVNGECRGIDWHDDKLYVIFDKQKKLEVMTTTGTVLQTFSTATNGQQLFQDPAYVTVSAANQRIYVSEYSMRHVVVLDMAGNQTGTYEDGELGRPRQLAVDGAGVMFLCDKVNNTVHLLSPAGEKVKILLTSDDGVVNPYGVCYCENTRRLYVGMSDCDTIKVFKVSF